MSKFYIRFNILSTLILYSDNLSPEQYALLLFCFGNDDIMLKIQISVSYTGRRLMKHLYVMIKPASSLCNLCCKYCFYADVAKLREVPSYGIMSAKTLEAVLHSIERELTIGDCLLLSFQGGEPTLAGLDYFHRVVKIVNEWATGIHVEYALQTNAMLLDTAWCAFLKEHRFLVGVSFDILRDLHDNARVDMLGNGTANRVEGAIDLLKHYGVEYNVLCTLTNAVARHPQQVWKRIVKMDLRYIQFTPCLDELKCPGESPYALTPERFASFYDGIFRLWLGDYRQGSYRSIRFLDDIISYLAFGFAGSCGIGGKCWPQIIVEADGSAYPCDFYCMDSYRLGDMTKQSISELLTSPGMRTFRTREHRVPKLCRSCQYFRFCGGGCKRMQHEMCCSEDDTVCGYAIFLEKHMPELRQLATSARLKRSQEWRCSR